MKANPSRHWCITLRGAKPTQAYASAIKGKIDDAISEADVMECQVNWQVREVTISILPPALRPGTKGRR